MAYRIVRPDGADSNSLAYVRVEFFDGPPPGNSETVTLNTKTTRIKLDLAKTRSARFRSGSAAARRKTVEQGRHPGGGSAPYGFDIVRQIDVMSGLRPLSQNGSYIVLENEARVVRTIFDLYLRTGSAAEVARTLKSCSIPAPAGGETWHRDIVLHIIQNTACIGVAPYGRSAVITTLKREADGSRPASLRKQQALLPEDQLLTIECPSLISDETFQAAQVLQRAMSRGPARVSSRAQKPLLEGFLWCGDCGAKMISGSYQMNATRTGGCYFACKKCAPTWNLENSPRPQWSAYPERALLPIAAESLRTLLPEMDLDLIVETIFSSNWNIELYKRRRLILLSQIQFHLFNNPFRIECRFPLQEEFPLAAAGLVDALCKNTRLISDEAAYSAMIGRGRPNR